MKFLAAILTLSGMLYSRRHPFLVGRRFWLKCVLVVTVLNPGAMAYGQAEWWERAEESQREWLPGKYSRKAVQYYDALDQAQWADVSWHVKYHGIRQAIFAGMEGSNRPRGKHGNEDSWQDVGIHYTTARLFRSVKGLRDLLRVHAFAAQLSAEIDLDNLTKEYRNGSTRPELNAAMRYPGGQKWRNRLKYGMTFIARQIELERRLIITKKSSRF